MNIKDLFIPFLFALFGTWITQKLFFSSPADTGIRSGSSFVAPMSQQEALPLNRDVDFNDEEEVLEQEYEVVETEYGTLTFSNYGAALHEALYKKVDETIPSVAMVLPDSLLQKEDRCFLVALPEKTPYYYRMMNRSDQDTTVQITYKADLADGGYIEKTFTITKQAPQITLDVALVPLQEHELDTGIRIVYPAPCIDTSAKHESISAVYNDEQGAIQKTAQGSLDMQAGRYNPSFFGIDSTYFIITLISNERSTISRGYYKVFGDRQLEAILESSLAVRGKTSLSCAFYMGPKEYSLIHKVDERLEETFNYSGILAPLSRLLVWLLRWINTYVKNYGIAIIILTFLFRFCMFPFTMNTEENLKQKSDFRKKLAYIEQRYKHNSELLNRERAELLRQQGFSGMAGCLPLLLQLPVFIALNRVLSGSFELYGAPFLWISDLSAPDQYYILPLLVTIVFALQAMHKDAQQKLTFLAIALVFGALTSNFSAGLALYIMVSTFMGFAQTLVMRLTKRA